MYKKKEIQYPICFGVIDAVFPKDENGYRNTPESCFECKNKTQCLKKAMTRPDGLAVREEFIDRAYDSKMIGFFERWARKKAIRSLKNRKGVTG